jgi:hypothetical protein
MYDYIQESIDRGECLLEWDGGPDHAPPPAPLLKDKFGSERRKAKVRRREGAGSVLQTVSALMVAVGCIR